MIPFVRPEIVAGTATVLSLASSRMGSVRYWYEPSVPHSNHTAVEEDPGVTIPFRAAVLPSSHQAGCVAAKGAPSENVGPAATAREIKISAQMIAIIRKKMPRNVQWIFMYLPHPHPWRCCVYAQSN